MARIDPFVGLIDDGDGTLTIPANYTFANDTARNSYFTTNASEKVLNLLILSNGAFQRWDGTAWVAQTAVARGAAGAAATVTVHSTVTGAAGSQANVTNEGSTSAAKFKFTIPQGADGKDGIDGTDGKDGDLGIVTVQAEHNFADEDARDAYFVLHPEELTTNLFIYVTPIFQMWDGTAWVDQSVNMIPKIGESMVADSMKASGVVTPVAGAAVFDMADGAIFTLTITEATELSILALADYLNRSALGIVDGAFALTFPVAKYIVLAGEYVTTKTNYIYFHCIEAGATPKFLITISQAK